MKKFLKSLVLMLSLVCGAYGQDQEFIRFMPGATEQDGEVQVAVTQLMGPNDVKITLYGVIHVADADYYAQVQKDLDTFDTVLYEGVKTGTMVNPETKILNAIQKGMGKVLGLTFQKDGIDYTRPNLVHADIGADELQAAMGEQPLTPFGQLESDQQDQVAPILDLVGDLAAHFLNTNPEWRNELKSKFGKQIAEADLENSFDPRLYKAIVIDRNQIVMDVLDAQLKDHPEKKNIAIFYGAGHNADFVKRFKAAGYKLTDQRWMPAWKLGNGAANLELEPR
ncbi:hypothetical protein C4588_02820 [Candidatus Parcubacteria bacterium]|nr:MAG: hypothetical protein C4588_02820 [Candidatus Parcubacteria bacterium]